MDRDGRCSVPGLYAAGDLVGNAGCGLGLAYLARLRAETLSSVRATCSHTLIRAAEVLDLFDCAEAILHAALACKETRTGDPTTPSPTRCWPKNC